MSPSMKKTIEKQVVIVGSGGCGKTCILHRIVTNNYSDNYVPTIFDNSTWTTRIQDMEIILRLKDTAGQEDYDRLVSLAVSGADIIIFCYAVNDRASFENIKNKYIHMIQPQDSQRAKFALVGNKTDLRRKSKTFVTTEEGIQLGNEIGANWVFECSAKDNTGIHEMFKTFATWSRGDVDNESKGLFERIKGWFMCGCCGAKDVEPEI